MFTCRASVWTSRPIAEAFEYVADARNRPDWDEDVISEELTSSEPIQVGSTVRTRLRSMGREYRYAWRITEHQPPTRVEIESTDGPFPTRLAFDLAQLDGGTRIDFAVTGRPSGALRLMQPLIARSTQAGLDRGFANLKRLLDAGSMGKSEKRNPPETHEA